MGFMQFERFRFLNDTADKVAHDVRATGSLDPSSPVELGQVNPMTDDSGQPTEKGKSRVVQVQFSVDGHLVDEFLGAYPGRCFGILSVQFVKHGTAPEEYLLHACGVLDNDDPYEWDLPVLIPRA